MIKNIIFDFDGVLADSEILVAKAFCKYLANRKIFYTEKQFSVYAGKKTIQVIEELSKKFNIIDRDQFFSEIMEIAKNIFSTSLTEVRGAEKFIKKNNFDYFIGSNSNKDRIMNGLKKIKFDKYISEKKIFSYDMVGKPKPHPDIYLSIIKTYNLIKEETLIIEDSYVGVISGVSTGFKVIGLTAGSHWFADRSFDELLEAGAYKVVNSYDNLQNEIEKL